MFDNLNLREWIVLMSLSVLAVVGLGDGQVGPAVLIAILAALFLYRRNTEQEQTTLYQDDYADYRDRDYEHRREIAQQRRPANVDEVHEHALNSVRRAGLDPNTVSVLPVDIGFLSFKDNNNPVIHRRQPIQDDVDYIQPFVHLRVPRMAAGRLKFEIMDASGERIFIHEEQYDLQRGRNLIMPAARLPIHDQYDMTSRWQMHVSADGMRLALHDFRFEEVDEFSIHPHVSQDGEISSEMKAMLQDSQLSPLSLDDLLASQEDEDAEQRGRM